MMGTSITSISTVRSSPVSVSVDCPPSLLGATSCRVTMPSISTLGMPPSVTARITRVVPGSSWPVGNIVLKIVDFLFMLKTS